LPTRLGLKVVREELVLWTDWRGEWSIGHTEWGRGNRVNETFFIPYILDDDEVCSSRCRVPHNRLHGVRKEKT
jgi:hypothetical protein